ncbi:hypothetical protein KTE28_04570 [Burkholderia multivorans]|uniref:hypothetical protein n=1 Tax=Burkholderia multivorans TaxID=87883 RepID=UPI001C211FAF|nr:hypothetical protein [Burkholderia multivorans]MBU9373597.1 hypothetical protein [Burkholderia multivorans]MBU9617674.1 hypothetical protein [Burkholderia multivorans]MDN7607765.1 hypothetical protein [Burkholderia multivorans]
MATLSMQAVVGRKTIHVVLMGDIATVNIFVTDNDDGSHQSQIMKVRQYLNAGMTNESVARDVLNVVVAAIERRNQHWAH